MMMMMMIIIVIIMMLHLGKPRLKVVKQLVQGTMGK